MASLGPIRQGDIVEVDKKGRRFRADVVAKVRGGLEIRPIGPNNPYFTATAHEVVRHWRQTKNVRKVTMPCGHDAD